MKAPKRRAATRPYQTDTPQLSDASIARIRGYAHRYVRAGGTIFLSMHPSDHDNHIGNVVKELKLVGGEEFEQALEETEFSHVEDEARLSNLADVYAAEHADAAFLFGGFVIAPPLPPGRDCGLKLAERERGDLEPDERAARESVVTLSSSALMWSLASDRPTHSHGTCLWAVSTTAMERCTAASRSTQGSGRRSW